MQENSDGAVIYTQAQSILANTITMASSSSIMTYAIQPTKFPIILPITMNDLKNRQKLNEEKKNLAPQSQPQISTPEEMPLENQNTWQVKTKRNTKKRPNEEKLKSSLAKKSVPSNNIYQNFVDTNIYTPLSLLPEPESNIHEEDSYISNEANENNETNNRANNDKKIPKPPPIFIENVTNFPAMINDIGKIIKQDEFTCKTLSNNQVKMNLNSIDSFRKLVKLLEAKQVAYHTYQLKQDKAYRVVIRNLHPSINTDDIKKALEDMGFEIRNIMNIRSRINKEPLPLFFVDQEPNEENKKIYDIKYLLHTKILVEPPRKKYDIPQCMRCQEYGHTKSYCSKPFYCVKCAGDHPTTTCTKAKNTMAKCILCQGPHPANYKGCTVYQNLQKSRNTLNKRKITVTNQNSEKVYTVRPNVNYAQATKSSESENNTLPEPEYTEVNNSVHFLNQFLAKFEQMFAQLMNQNNMIINLMTTMMNKINNG